VNNSRPPQDGHGEDQPGGVTGHLVNLVRGEDQAAGVMGHLANLVRGEDQAAGGTGHLVNLVRGDDQVRWRDERDAAGPRAPLHAGRPGPLRGSRIVLLQSAHGAS